MPNQDSRVIALKHMYQEGSFINLHLTQTQSSLIESQLDLSMKDITIISGMRSRIMPFTPNSSF
jgi:hypothetical protein